MKRKTPLRADPEKTRAWKERAMRKAISKAYEKKKPYLIWKLMEKSHPHLCKPIKNKRHEFKQRSSKRAHQETVYTQRSRAFVLAHPICPVTKGRTCQLHHSAKRSGEWLLLERYWIAVSADGHAWIEANKREAEKLGLMVRIKETYKEHVKQLLEQNKSLVEPIFYLDSLNTF